MKLKSKNYLALIRITPLAIIFDSSVASVKRVLHVAVSSLPESRSNPIQYLVSFALFKAISWNFLNSKRELEDCASTRLAPILVPDLSNCLAII